MATELASAYLTLMPTLKNAQRQIESQLNGVDVSGSGKRMGTTLSSGFGSAFKTVAKVGVGAVAAIGTAVGGLALGGGISRALKLDQAQFKFRALGMDVESAMASCSAAVSGTAFGLDAAATVATQLGASGVEAGDAMTGALKSVAGVAAMSGRSMEDIGSIFSKVAAKGKVSGDELLQLNEAGINATAALAKHLGKTSEEVQKLVSSGQIDFATFSAAMQETFGEAAAGANETFQGAMSNVMAALSRVGAKFADPALGGLRKVFVALIPAIDAVSKALDPAVEAFGRFSDAVSARTTAGIEAFADAASSGKGALGSLGAAISALSGMSSSSFSGVRDAVDGAMSKLNSFLKVVQMGASPLAYFQTALVGLRKGGVEGAVTAIASLSEKIGGFGGAVTGHLKLLEMGASPAKVLQSALGQLGSTILAGPAAAMRSLSYDFAQWLSRYPAVCAAVEGIQARFGEMAGAVSPVVDAVRSRVEALFAAFSARVPTFDQVVSTIASAHAAVSPILDALKQKVSDAFAFIANTFLGANVDATAFSAAFGGALLFIAPKVTALLAPFGGLVGALSAVATSIGAVLPKIGLLASKFALVGTLSGPVGILKGVGSGLAGLISPVGLVVAGIAALAAGFAYLMVTNEGFRDTIMGLVGQIGSALAPAIETVVSSVSALIAAVLPAVMSIMGQLLPVIGQVIELVFQVLAALAPVVSMIVSTLVPVLAAVIAIVVNVVSVVVSAVMPVISAIVSAVSSAMPVIQGVVEGALGVIGSVFQGVWNAVQIVVSTVMGVVQSLIGIGLAAINGDWTGVWNGVKSLFSSIWDGILASAKNGVDTVVSVVTGIKDTVLNFFAGAGQWLCDAGSAIVQGLIDGITGMIGAAGDAIGNVMVAVSGFLPHSPAKKGPFSGRGWSLYSGQAITEALGEGIAGRASAAVSAIGRVMDAVAGEARSPISTGGISAVPYDALSVDSPGVVSGRGEWQSGNTSELLAQLLAELRALRSEYVPASIDGDVLVSKTSKRMERSITKRNQLSGGIA